MSDMTHATPPAATFDSLVLAAAAREIRSVLPARVGRASQTAANDVFLPLRAGAARGVLLSCDTRWPRAHLARTAPARDILTPFAQLLRARFSDARIVAARQPAFERVLVLEIDALDGRYELVAELTGKHANLILVAGGEILGAVRTMGPDRSKRPVLPGWRYEPPPPDPRPTLEAVDAQALAIAMRAGSGPLWRRVLGAVGGIGPLSAYEIAHRATGAPDADAAAVAGAPAGAPDADAAAVAGECARAIADACRAAGAAAVAGAFDPRILLAADDERAADGFAPWPLSCVPEVRQRPSTMSEAVEAAFERRAGRAALDEERRALLQRIDALAARKRRALAESRQALLASEDAARLRMMGELLLTHATRVLPGAGALETLDYEGAPVVVPMDPRASAVANAQAYFRRYAKAQAVARSLPARVAQLEADESFLAATRLYAEHAQNAEDLFELREEIAEAGYPEAARAAAPRGRSSRRRPRAVSAARAFEVEGFAVLVGRTNRDNDHVTFKVASSDDLWLHARGVPGAHVVLRTGGRRPTPAAIEAAAAIAAHFSAARDAVRVAVDVVERRNVSKPKGAAHGAVHYRGERTLHVRPDVPGTPRGS